MNFMSGGVSGSYILLGTDTEQSSPKDSSVGV